jgi:archaellum component FlaF (FlaF/FlaG flagellin family)
MFKKLGCLLPVLAILLFLTYISIKQGYNTIFHEDWSEYYSSQKVVVVDIAIDSSFTSANAVNMGGYHYSFNPMVEHEINGKTVVDTVLFLTSNENSDWYPGDSLDITFNDDSGNISMGTDTDKNFTGIVNIIMGLVFLFLSYLIIRSIHRKRVAKVKEVKL